MPSFLGLPPEERSRAYRAVTLLANRSAVILEKDTWVCWALSKLFGMPNRLPMAFKGGTSLSKVYGAIFRFSEDIDLTLDLTAGAPKFDPFDDQASKSSIKKHREKLGLLTAEHVANTLKPYLEKCAEGEAGSSACEFTIEGMDQEQLILRYPTALDPGEDYIKRQVSMEFGGHNSLVPAETKIVEPHLRAYLAVELSLPQARVNVLSPARTFWEKATLIHVECCRREFRIGKERPSRHWYDLATLADQKIGRDALAARDILEDVVRWKKTYWPTGSANYDDCLRQRLRLVPHASALEALRQDYSAMVSHGMFEVEPPEFEEVVTRLERLETEINGRRSDRDPVR